MFLHFLPDNPTVADVDHAISRARQAAVVHREAGDTKLAALAVEAVDAAFVVRAALSLRLCYADHRCAAIPVVVYRFAHDSEVRLCGEHLDLWLDLADDEEIDEPAGLTWLAPCAR